MKDAGSEEWQEANHLYLEAALSWLKLRLYKLLPPDHAGSAMSMSTPLPPHPGSQAFPVASSMGAPDVAQDFQQGQPRGGVWGRFLRRGQLEVPPASSEQVSSPVGGDAIPLLSMPATITEEHLQPYLTRMLELEAGPHPPALTVLAEVLNLSDFERDVVLLCVGIELSSEVGRLCARLNGDPLKTYPTFSIALAALRKPGWEALSPEGMLRHWQLIEINQPGAQPLTTSALRADERIVNYVVGLDYLDDRLALRMEPVKLNEREVDLPPSQWLAVQAVGAYLEGARQREEETETEIEIEPQAEADAGSYHKKTPRAIRRDLENVPVIQLLGNDRDSKRLVAWRAATDYGLQLYRLPAEMLPAQPGDLEIFARLWERECKLQDLALLLEVCDLEPSSEKASLSTAFVRFLSRTKGLSLLDTQDVRPEVGRSSVVVEVDKPTASEQRHAWVKVLGKEAHDICGLLASQFDLNISTIKQIAETARPRPGYGNASLQKRLWEMCLVRTRPRMEALASRVECKAKWEDLVLPDAEKTLLRQIVAQVLHRTRVYDEWGFRARMNRGLGITVLFAGESGTGKTMAAEVIANELGLDLYQIDLSAVVSKYIGETEKNLRSLFDAAEGGGVILCFNEADALFGKRSEVKDSHDRYANIEINYLLQRMEAYRGLAILTTNMKNALDQAFLRRLRFIVDFPFPAQRERENIWRKVFPSTTPRQNVIEGEYAGVSASKAELDYVWLSRLNLTGGSIHNIALTAAFLAAHEGNPVTMKTVLVAARIEYRKLERPTNADFDWQPQVTPKPEGKPMEVLSGS
jgi:DNA polymerase III delta prime subunit